MSQVSDFLKAHERLILILTLLLGGIWLAHRWINHIAEVDNAKEIQAKQILDTQKETNQQQAETVKRLEDLQSQLVQQLTQQNSQLMSGIHARSQVTIVQQAKDKTMPLPDLSKRWQDLAGLQPTDLAPTDTGVAVTDAGARLTVQKLELVPELQATITDGKQILENKDEQIAQGEKVQQTYKDQVSGLMLEIVDSKKQCKAEIAAVKATARKGKWRAFGWGVGAGVTAMAIWAAKIL